MTAPHPAPDLRHAEPRDAAPRHVEVTGEGRVLASAEVLAWPDPQAAVAVLHIESGHLPAGTRTRLVDAVLASPAVTRALVLTAASPAGDVEVTDRLRELLADVEVHPAGVTTIVRGAVRRA